MRPLLDVHVLECSCFCVVAHSSWNLVFSFVWAAMPMPMRWREQMKFVFIKVANKNFDASKLAQLWSTTNLRLPWWFLRHFSYHVFRLVIVLSGKKRVVVKQDQMKPARLPSKINVNLIWLNVYAHFFLVLCSFGFPYFFRFCPEIESPINALLFNAIHISKPFQMNRIFIDTHTVNANVCACVLIHFLLQIANIALMLLIVIFRDPSVV